jgi:acyl-CoA synthetase (AMP-forming)/AMP-acid ligase II
MNLYSMLADSIRRLHDKVAVAHGSASLTFRQFDRASAAAAEHYRAAGCERGDRVVLFLRNGLAYAPLMLGAMRAGMVAVPVNAKLHADEVAWICANAGAKLLVTHREYVEPLRAACGDAAPRIVDVGALDLAFPGDPPPVAEVSPDDPAWLFYTSGTTGRPKGATLTHRNLVAATVNCLADLTDFRTDDRVLHVAPLSHGSGLYLLPALARGATNLVHDKPGFQPDEVLATIARERVSIVAFMAPTMIVRLLDAAPRDDIGCLRGVNYGGATIHLEHIRAAVARFGPIFHQLYGQGEAPMTISGLPARDHKNADDDTLLSAGHVRAGVEVRVVDENDVSLPQGEVGEICVRGDVVMAGYWHNPEATAKTLKGDWLHTGDIGRFDAGGRLRVLDRRHDTIISGGTNIYPKEVEDVIAAHPAVREVIAFGVPDREWGESVAVAIVAEGALDAAAVQAFCRERLASFKKPKHVHFLSDLPKSAYGKVLRRELRERFSAGS